MVELDDIWQANDRSALEVQKLSTKVWVFKPLKMTFQSCNSGDSFWSLGLGV